MKITVNKCAKCGHEWPQSGKVPPRRCPAAGCRTVKWKRHSISISKEDMELLKKESAASLKQYGNTATAAALQFDEERRAKRKKAK